MLVGNALTWKMWIRAAIYPRKCDRERDCLRRSFLCSHLIHPRFLTVRGSLPLFWFLATSCGSFLWFLPRAISMSTVSTCLFALSLDSIAIPPSLSLSCNLISIATSYLHYRILSSTRPYFWSIAMDAPWTLHRPFVFSLHYLPFTVIPS